MSVGGIVSIMRILLLFFDSGRLYRVVNLSTGITEGRYFGFTPKQAASKAFTHIFKKKIVIKFMHIECDRVKLSAPEKLIITDKATGIKKNVTYAYRNILKKIPVPENIVIN